MRALVDYAPRPSNRAGSLHCAQQDVRFVATEKGFPGP